MAHYVEVDVDGDALAVAAIAARVLESNRYQLTWRDDLTATGERGSKALYLLHPGALFYYVKIGLSVTSPEPGEATVHIERQSSGWWGGFFNAASVKTMLELLRVELEEAFANAGILLGSRDG